MVFDCVYGRPEAVATGTYARLRGHTAVNALAPSPRTCVRVDARPSSTCAGRTDESYHTLFDAPAIDTRVGVLSGGAWHARSICPPHAMLLTDQRASDGLLFARRIADRLRAEEFNRARRAAAPT